MTALELMIHFVCMTWGLVSALGPFPSKPGARVPSVPMCVPKTANTLGEQNMKLAVPGGEICCMSVPLPLTPLAIRLSDLVLIRGSMSIIVALSHCLTVSLSHCITVSLSQCPTVVYRDPHEPVLAHTPPHSTWWWWGTVLVLGCPFCWP